MRRSVRGTAFALLLLASACGGGGGGDGTTTTESSTTLTVDTTPETSPVESGVGPGDVLKPECDTDHVSLGVIEAGDYLVSRTLFEKQADDLDVRVDDLSGCTLRSRWSDDLRRYAVSFTLPGVDGTHVGYVDMVTGHVVDVTAPRVAEGFGAVPAFDEEPMFFAPSTDVVRFPGDQILARGSGTSGESEWHVISVENPTEVIRWSDTPSARAQVREPFLPADDKRYDVTGPISSDGRFEAFSSSGALGSGDAYVAGFGGAPLHRITDSPCGAYEAVVLGWQNASTVVFWNFGSNGNAPGTIKALRVADGVPGTCEDLLPSHTKRITSVRLRPDGQAILIKLEGDNEPWYEEDLTKPGSDPVPYTGSVPDLEYDDVRSTSYGNFTLIDD
jgi:hypothetical protein